MKEITEASASVGLLLATAVVLQSKLDYMYYDKMSSLLLQYMFNFHFDFSFAFQTLGTENGKIKGACLKHMPSNSLCLMMVLLSLLLI